LADAQIDTLMSPIKPSRVAKRTQGGKQLSYVEAWDVRAHLIRLFGFGGFDAQVLNSEIVFVRDYTNSDNKPMQEVAYRATVRLVIRNLEGIEVARYAECAVGSASGGSGFGDLHDNALKSAVSDALKRCATNLGSQFGLSLYQDGSQSEVIRKLVVDPRGPQEEAVTEKQQEVLNHSLGATQEGSNDGVSEPASGPEPVPASAS